MPQHVLHIEPLTLQIHDHTVLDGLWLPDDSLFQKQLVYKSQYKQQYADQKKQCQVILKPVIPNLPHTFRIRSFISDNLKLFCRFPETLLLI